MEITGNYQLEWLRVEKFQEGVIVYCPAIHEGLDGKPNKLGKFKRIVAELKRLEKELVEDFPWCVMYTELKNDHIMRIYRKLDYIPYDLNLKYDTLWFVKKFAGFKDLRGEENDSL